MTVGNAKGGVLHVLEGGARKVEVKVVEAGRERALDANQADALFRRIIISRFRRKRNSVLIMGAS